ncbi:MAG: hypothetical protein Q8922_02610 [Bacteroidota bacterium]|nr:hypothetical protein [Bacteroidota bacterium]MDP4234742.1 hypothetical protein [Bacteroidota bacterium]MDP4242634.1 hypothetical protein [Bacteroidota bacterium]MDP4286804.1 hypothetical protein [Bacteroidota bacterium]
MSTSLLRGTGIHGPRWNRTTTLAVASLLLAVAVSSCRDIGFHELDVSAKSRASAQMARDVMSDLQHGLHVFYEQKHHFPATTEAHLYDSIRNDMSPALDPIHLYRNDNGKGYFIAVGSRAGRIVYRYPPTIGAGDYTLYWVGPNGVDEEGEGDDVDAWQGVDTARHFERQRLADLEADHDPERLLLVRTGPDLFRDSVRFTILRHDTVFYQDAWPLTAYFQLRPELTDEVRRRMVRAELDQFLAPGAFVHTDSLENRGWSKWAEVNPKSAELAELQNADELMFNYYAGDRGSKGIAWLKSKKKFVVVWKN